MIRRTFLLAASFLIAAAPLTLRAQTQTPAPKAVDITGKWAVELHLEMGTSTPTLELKQQGEKLTGTYTGRYGAFPLEGTVKDRTLAFSFKMNADGTEVSMSFTGEVAADAQTMKGKAELEGLGDATWNARRSK